MKTRKEKERKRREREEEEKTRAESRLRPPPCGWNQLHGDQCQYNVHDHAPVWFAFESRWSGTSAGFLSRGLTKKGGAIVFPFLLSRSTSIHPCSRLLDSSRLRSAFWPVRVESPKQTGPPRCPLRSLSVIFGSS
ncbi:hypothetical protein V1477_013056 [Vespula maculifrons]|uniref:Uncharacterized protein n=1 Tax=Vespula maculifrons TaxID=7453 RepID=A0ABD2BUV3_VESMC